MLKVEKLDRRKKELKAHTKDLAALTASLTKDILGPDKGKYKGDDPAGVVRSALCQQYFRVAAITEEDIARETGKDPGWVADHCKPGLVARVWLDTWGDKCKTPRQTILKEHYEQILRQVDGEGNLVSTGTIEVPPMEDDRPTGALEEMPDKAVVDEAKAVMHGKNPSSVTVDDVKLQRIMRRDEEERAAILLNKKESKPDFKPLVEDISTNQRDVRIRVGEATARAEVLLKTEPNPVPRDEAMETLESIRKLFVFAKPGAFPSVLRIMSDLGLMDKQGREAAHSPVTIEQVLSHMENEDWKGQRRDYIMRINDFVEEERLVYDRQVIQRIKGDLESQIVVVQRLLMRYWQTGKFSSLEGSVALERPPALQDLVSLAETYRRLVEGNALIKQNIYMTKNEQNNNLTINKESPLLGSFIQNLRTMTPEQALMEASKLESIAGMLSPAHFSEIEAMRAEVVEQRAN